ncbi:hypothetical protein [Lentzea nigeriaca]|uniref:hypothetical protein n=1 Tax=Lentzea nigeriaca TaxID=1128665 RepID=UPI00195BFFD6|nr:hypothetical protein [Lentzea nigeriaca]MBM7862607.1 hypothetical protein [Lentzea nigeriaca]
MNTVLDGLASNPALPAALLDRLIVLADPVVTPELAARSDLTPAQVRALLAREDPAVVSALLGTGLVAPADVPWSNPSVALVVTAHPDAPPSVCPRTRRTPGVQGPAPGAGPHVAS